MDLIEKMVEFYKSNKKYQQLIGHIKLNLEYYGNNPNYLPFIEAQFNELEKQHKNIRTLLGEITVDPEAKDNFETEIAGTAISVINSRTSYDVLKDFYETKIKILEESINDIIKIFTNQFDDMPHEQDDYKGDSNDDDSDPSQAAAPEASSEKQLQQSPPPSQSTTEIASPAVALPAVALPAVALPAASSNLLSRSIAHELDDDDSDPSQAAAPEASSEKQLQQSPPPSQSTTEIASPAVALPAASSNLLSRSIADELDELDDDLILFGVHGNQGKHNREILEQLRQSNEVPLKKQINDKFVKIKKEAITGIKNIESVKKEMNTYLMSLRKQHNRQPDLLAIIDVSIENNKKAGIYEDIEPAKHINEITDIDPKILAAVRSGFRNKYLKYGGSESMCPSLNTYESKYLKYGESEASRPKLDKDVKHLYLKYGNAESIPLEQIFLKKYLLYKKKYLKLKKLLGP